jgi:cellulose synthase/poly-beta-1,6-N-acetylglucosamine synthase-like glycosyltransferase
MESFLAGLMGVAERGVSEGTWDMILQFIPFVIFFELPMYLLIFLGVLKYCLTPGPDPAERRNYPSVSCLITCYSEGKAVQGTIRTLAEQIYPGRIQILPMIDGASRNRDTLEAALGMAGEVGRLPRRSLKVIPKWQRGGRVSALNTGLNFATGEVVMALDGDTSFDNDMVEKATRHFEDPSVGCVSGCLRVRNAGVSLVTRLQAIEYFLSIQASKTGLGAFGVVNNISGAFGIFRRSVLDLIRGWDAGTAEDLDLTLRVKNYARRGGFRIVFDPEALGFTDVPDTLMGFLKQRMRWDGDLSYLYFRKHAHSFNPRLVGWKNFILLLWSGLFFQIVMPLLIILYTGYLFITYPLGYVLELLALIYLFYFLILAVLFLVFVLLISERPREDLKGLPYLPLVPCFAFLCRINNGFATLWEILGKGHRDSSMAPWWTLRKSKF